MERVNGIRSRAVTNFGPDLSIESLTYVDDIAGGGNKDTIETTITNCAVLEEKKKASVNLEKSKWMKVGTNIGVIDDGDDIDGDWSWQAYLHDDKR